MISMKKLFLTILFGALLVGTAGVANAQSLSEDMQRQNEAFVGKQGADMKARDPRVLVGEIIKVALTLIGTIFVAYTVYGGFIIMTANGNDENITKARSIITQGAIGVAVALSAYSIAFLVYRFMLQSQQNPFATFAGWGIEADTSGFYNTDPLEDSYIIPIDNLPSNP